jgi:iron(III) transport system permease protein
VGGLVFLLASGPLFLPIIDLARQPAGWQAWVETDRLVRLFLRTVALAFGAVTIAGPLGTATAIFFYRTDLPLRRLFQYATVLTLFVPLPLVASAWQAALGIGGWLPSVFWSGQEASTSGSGSPWQPWTQGMAAAIWVHGMAGLPWFIWIVGQGLSTVDRAVEEDGLTMGSPLAVILRITLPLSRPSFWVASAFVILQTFTEISVTDVMRVSTFAEEVYTQMVVSDDDYGVVRSVAVCLPLVGLAWLLLLGLIPRLEKKLPSSDNPATTPLLFLLGRLRWPALVIAGAAWAGLAGIPVASLVWKTGLGGYPEQWSPAVFQAHLTFVLDSRWGLIGRSLALALLAGMTAAATGLFLAWLAHKSRWFSAAVLAYLALAWAMPAPIVGMGLKETIARLLDLTHSGFLNKVLYSGPSLAPVLWVNWLRFLPFAVAIIWPAIRLIPLELRETAQLEGAGPEGELRWVVLPLAWPAVVQGTIVVAILSLGELGAGKLAEIPGSQTIAHEIFNLMHYGVTNDVAAMCLVLLGFIAVGALVLAFVSRFVGRRQIGQEGQTGKDGHQDVSHS